MKYFEEGTSNHGLSSVAIVVIAAVAIGGGVLLFSGDNETTEEEAETATTTEESTEADDDMTTFVCENGGEITADASIDGEVTVTLPNGDVETVTEAEATEGTLYSSADGSFTFLSQEGEAVVEQDGEVTFDGCMLVSSGEVSGEENTVSDDENAEAGAEIEIETEDTPSATTSGDAELEVDVDDSVEVEADSETEAGAEY